MASIGYLSIRVTCLITCCYQLNIWINSKTTVTSWIIVFIAETKTHYPLFMTPGDPITIVIHSRNEDTGEFEVERSELKRRG